MVAYLKKIEDSEGFHQIVDFLNTSHIRYALTENPTIYVSLIQQFWQTATASTLDNGEMEITATIDGKVKIGEGSTVPVESYHTPTCAPSTSQPHLSPTLRSSIRQETEVPQPSSPPHTNVADEAASTGVDVRYGGATTTVTGLEAGQGSGNIDKIPTMPHDSPLPRVHILGSDEGKMQHNELMNLVTKLSDRVVALETDLTQTNKVYGAAFTKLIKKVKRLEKKDKLSKSRRKLRLGITLVQMGVSTASTDFTTADVPVTTVGAEISTANPEVKIAGVSVDDIAAESLVYIKKSAAKKKDKAARLQEEFDEEERQRIARVHEAARSFSEVEWEDIRARVEASEELVQRLHTEEREKELVADSSQAAVIESTEAEGTKRAAEEELGQRISKKKKSDELSQEELHQLMIIVPEEGMNIEALQTKYPIIDWEVYTEDSRMDDLVNLWILVQERINSTKPTEDKQIEIWVKLKRLFEPDDDDELWKSQKHIHDITWRLYDTCGVHHVSTKDGMDIYMLVEREYPLSRGVLTQMLVAKLLVEQNNEMSRELLRKIFMQIERPRR
ncbi:hypothetical protein Tco_1102441 [Tanacetum coccineum]